MALPPGDSPAWQQALAESLSEALPRLLGERADPLLKELITALTAALCRGELALELDGEAPGEVTTEQWPAGHRNALQASRLCRDPDGPLVLVGRTLQWRRWRLRQQAVLTALLERAGRGPVPADDPDPAPRGSDPMPQPLVDGEQEHLLQELDAGQRQAVRLALERSLVLILGGPGTGKTRTVAALLRVLRARHPHARIQLAAPTGKAAARLRAACGGGESASTLHRLLESRGDGFGRDHSRPLELDWLVIDEVSMLDLELMEAVLAALPSDCRLVLVGDPAQLAPVAPGSLLLALEGPEPAAALARVRIVLATTHRNNGAIARVAAALRQQVEAGGGRPLASGTAAVLDPLIPLRPLLSSLRAGDNLRWQEVPAGRLPADALARLVAHQRRLAQLAQACWPDRQEGWQELLAERDRLLLLSPQRRGRWGVEAIHRALLGSEAEAHWPAGTPLLCRRNLPALGLSNGDIGILVRSPTAGDRRAGGGDGGANGSWLLFGQEEPLWRHPAQLTGALEPALALTVHKAQGSEARELILLLDNGVDRDGRLLYTALTRAREQAWLISATGGPGPQPPAIGSTPAGA